jgi:hypothetical protein
MEYKITVECLGEETSNTGDTILETLDKFKMGWLEIKGKGTVIIKKGKKEYIQFFNAPQLRRVFNNKLTKEITAKRWESIFE